MAIDPGNDPRSGCFARKSPRIIPVILDVIQNGFQLHGFCITQIQPTPIERAKHWGANTIFHQYLHSPMLHLFQLIDARMR
jgi:hypothetical protein